MKAILFGLGTAAVAYGVYAGMAYRRYGVQQSSDDNPRLDNFMPRFEVRDLHQRVVDAPPSRTFEAVHQLSMADSPVIRAIFGMRELPSRIRGTLPEPTPRRPALEEVRAFGWRQVDYQPDRAVVMAAVTQPWHADVEFVGLAGDEFVAFDDPGYSKIVWSIETLPRDGRHTLVRMETRVSTTDPASREKFRRYWALLSPGIIAIRHELLRLTKRSAEALDAARCTRNAGR